MKGKLFFIFFFTFCFSKGQSLTQDIYDAIDLFYKNPTLKNIQWLYQAEQKFLTSKAEKTTSVYSELIYLYATIGHYEFEYNNLIKATEYYEKAWVLYQTKPFLNDFDISLYVLKSLGTIYTILGNYNQAENIILAYKYHGEKENNYNHYASAVNNLCIVYNHTNRSQKALTLLKETLYKNKYHPSKKNDLLFQLAETHYFLNEFDKSKKILQALEKEESQLTLFAKIYFQEKNYAEALVYVNQVLKEASNRESATKRELAKSHLLKAQILKKLNKSKLCEEEIKNIFILLSSSYHSNNIIPKDEDLYLENTFLDALDLLAKIFYEEKDYNQALSCYQKAYVLNNKLSLSIPNEQSTLISNTNNRFRLEQMLNIYAKNKDFADEKDLKETLVLHEQTKQLFIKSQHQTEKSDQEKKLTALLQDNDHLISLENDINKKNQLIVKQNQLFLQLKKLSKTNNFNSELDITKIQKTLKNQDAIAIQYFVGQNNIYEWQISSSKIALKTIPLNSISKQLKDYINLFENSENIENHFDKYLLLGQFLYKHLLYGIKRKNIYLITDGLLDQVALESLLTEKPINKTFAQLPYLFKKHQLSYLFSLSDLKEKEMNLNYNVLGVFPIFKNTNRELLQSEKEYQTIKSLVKGKHLLAKNATYANFKNKYQNYNLLHLATHANSKDSLGQAQISFIDQDVSFQKIYALKLNKPLVILSACETGIGQNHSGEGNMSVARGFRFAGAKSIMFSLWKTNDLAALDIVSNFYRQINSRNPNISLHQSKIDYLTNDEISDNKKSPYYWSSFVMYGEAFDNTNNFWYWIIGLIVSLLLFYFVKKKFF